MENERWILLFIIFINHYMKKKFNAVFLPVFKQIVTAISRRFSRLLGCFI